MNADAARPAPACVHVFGPGARGRALCAALVESVLPGTVVVEFADETSALEAARGLPGRCPVVDARLAPEPEAFAAFARGDEGRAHARGFDGSVRDAPAAYLVGASRDGNDAIVGDWLDDPAPRTAPERGSTIEVHSPGLGHGGYASAGRNTIVGLHHAGVEVAWRQFYPERDAEIDPGDRALLVAARARSSRGDRALVIQPPTHVTGQLFLERYVEAYARTPYACYTMFETDAVPERWPALLSRAGRVWVPSLFNVETFAAAGIPRELIEYVPLGLEVERMPVDGEGLDIPQRRGFTFLSVFGFTSRKGWDVLIDAWAQAFDASDDVSLVLRTSAGNVDVRAEIERFIVERRIDPARLAPVVLLHQSLSARALAALYRSSDAFVLPSRGEGVGLPYLEAMAFGLPTIGTGWSGATEFLNDETGYVISSTPALVDRMTARTFPILRDQHWAEPSVASTAERLRQAYADAAATRRRAALGYARARTRYNRMRTGRIAAAALERIAPRPRFVTTTRRAAVALAGPLFSIDGAGASARATIAALDALGIPVHAIAEGEDDRPVLFLDDARIVTEALARPGDPNLPAIVQGNRTRRLRFCGGEHVLAIPEPIDVTRWTPQIGALSGLGAAGSLRFLTTARLEETSGYAEAIGAFLRAFEPGDDAMLTIKVPGQLDPAHAQALVAAAARRYAPERAGQLDRYRISIAAGLGPEGDYMQLLGSFDAFVHLPRRPGWSRALLEAMAAALPCIALPAAAAGTPLSPETGYPAAGPDGAADAMRGIARDGLAALMRGHAARRAVVAEHALPVAGRALRDRLEALVSTPFGPTREPEPEPDRLGILVDARAGEDCAALAASLPALTRAPHRVEVLRDDGRSLAAACAAFEDARFVAYLRGDVVLTAAWDVPLRDALRSRPLLALAVPRIVDAPAPQGLPRPESLADYAQGLTLTQVGRGVAPVRIAASCVLADRVALQAALEAGNGTIDAALQALGRGGSAAWCAFDVLVDRPGDRPWPIVELG